MYIKTTQRFHLSGIVKNPDTNESEWPQTEETNSYEDVISFIMDELERGGVVTVKSIDNSKTTIKRELPKHECSNDGENWARDNFVNQNIIDFLEEYSPGVVITIQSTPKLKMMYRRNY